MKSTASCGRSAVVDEVEDFQGGVRRVELPEIVARGFQVRFLVHSDGDAGGVALDDREGHNEVGRWVGRWVGHTRRR